MPFSFATPLAWPTSAATSSLGALQAAGGNEHRFLRVVLLALGLLVPLNLPFSVPLVGPDGSMGWSVATTRRTVPETDLTRGHADHGHPVVTRVARRARPAGILPGDRLVSIDGVTADSASLARRRASLRVGDTLTLQLEHRGRLHSARIRVETSTVGYTWYTVYVIVLTCVSWCVGMALVAWRGQSALALLLGAALLLVPPIAFLSGVPGNGALLSAVRTLWHYEAAAFRLLFPAFLLHAVALRSPRPLARSPVMWACIYLTLAWVMLAVTGYGRDPLAWTQPGSPARNARLMVGFSLEALTAAAATLVLLRSGATQPAPLRFVHGSIALAGATAAVFSFTTLWLGSWVGDEFVSGVHSLAMLLLPVSAALYFFGPGRPEASAWHARRWAASALSLGLAAVHGLVIAAAVAVVLNGSGQDLGGVEWLLLVTVLAATLLPAPALRWVQALVDRRLLARWVEAEARAQAFVYELNGELDPLRIAQRVAGAIPTLLEVTAAELVFSGESLARWGVGADVDGTPPPAAASDAELAELVEAASSSGAAVFPVHGGDRTVVAALRVGPRVDGRPIDLPARAIITTICQGVSAALMAAKAHRDLRSAEAGLADAERIAAFGALTGGLAHEIKNPLAGLKMGVYVLQRDGVDPAKLARFERDIGRIDDLVTGLLRFTNDRAKLDGALGAPEPVDLRAIAAACVAEVRPGADERRITLIERYPDQPVVLLGSPGQFRLVVLNLVANALESVGEGGRVTVALDVLPSSVEITVLDDGPGIPPAILHRVFDLSFTTKRGGTGIGLALVRRETERLGGSAEVAFSTEHGTLLRVTLPRAA
jgi:signal transduction histidine kinase